jgi:hypothetical protein
MYIALIAPKRNELWVSDIDGGNKAKIATGEHLGTGTWASDNFHLSFEETGAGAGAKTYIVGADGSGLRQLPPTGGNTLNSVWSPDKKSLYVSILDGAMLTVLKWRVEGSNLEKFVDNCGVVTDIDPEGQYLLGVLPFGE